MVYCEDSSGCTTLKHLNAELTHAESELSSVEFTLRGLLRTFSVEQIARHAQYDLISKPLNRLAGLQNFYFLVNARYLDNHSQTEIQDSAT